MTPLRRTALALALPALLLTGCGSSGSTPSAAAAGGTVAAAGPAQAQTATVTGTPSLSFAPATVTAKPGVLRLTLALQAGPPHDLVFDDATLGKDIPVTSSGSSTSTFTFSKAGTYRFVCTIHPGMEGKVVVS